MDKFTVTTKVNHDSLWTKATFADKTWVKFSVTRSSIGSRGTANEETFKALANVAEKTYQAWKKLKDATYGELVDLVAKAWTEMDQTRSPAS